MDNASLRRSHHHHYHHHCHFICHHRHRHFICHHSPALAIPPPPPALQYPHPIASVILRPGLNLETFRPEERPHHGESRMLQEEEYDEQIEEDEEPIFVLTDEWKEFFAKSKAKRKLEGQEEGKELIHHR